MTIRRTPEDFRVGERLAPGVLLAEPAAFRVYTLEKVSLTTPEAVGRLAAALGVRAGLVEPAGLKDKHALTTQHVSVPAGEGGRPLPDTIEGHHWKAAAVGWCARALSAADIACNAFEIVVRGLDTREYEAMALRAAELAHPASDRPVFTNYFGDQRFGSARHGQGFAADHLLRGDFEGALRLLIATPARKDAGARRTFTRALAQRWGAWGDLIKTLPRVPERAAVEALAEGRGFRDAFAALPHLVQVFAIESYQSMLWNAAAADLTRGLCKDAAAAPIDAPGEAGPLVFAPARAVPESMEVAELPTPGPELAEASETPMSRAMLATLKARGLAPEALRIPGLRRPAFGVVPRPVFCRADAFAGSEPVRDEFAAPKSPKRWAARVYFELPRGAYATVLLRALGQ